MRGLSKARGGLAQLGEHLLCKQGVVGSIPSSSTIDTIEIGQEIQHQSVVLQRFDAGSYTGEWGLRIPGCSLKIHRVEISVAGGNCTFVKVSCRPCHQRHFDCVKAKFNFEQIELNTA
jgi:hypothetical protein